MHEMSRSSKRYYLLFPLCFFVLFCISLRSSKLPDLSTDIQMNDANLLNNQADLDDFLAKAMQICKSYNFVYFTLINQAYYNLTNNWLCNTVLMNGVHERTLIVTMDLKSERMLKKLWPNVAVSHLNLSSDHRYDKKLDWGEKAYVHFLTLRSHFLTSLVDANMTFVLFETDALWLKNPTDYFSNFMIKSDSSSFDIVVPVKYKSDEFGRDLTFNPMLVNPNWKTKKFFRQMSSTLSDNSKLYDQDVFDDMCKSNYSDVACRTFPYDDVSDGYWFDLSPKYRKQFDPYIVNNNYYVGVDHKITRQALNGFWYLKPKEKSCDFVMMEHKFSNGRIKW